MRTFSSLAALMFVAHLFTVATVARQVGHPKEPHGHAEAAKMKNPVPADAASLEAGKKLYTEQCAGCHGDTGKGDGPMAAYTGEPLPSNLSDGEWSHGSSDGEIYAIIRDGTDGTAMKDFAKDLTETETWHVVNYVKTLAPKPAQAH